MALRVISAGILCLCLVLAIRERASASVFCEADIAALGSVSAPARASAGMHRPSVAFVLESNSPATLSGDVVVLTADAAYDVNFSNLVAAKNTVTGRGATQPILVTFQKPVDIDFAWVDQIGVNGAAPHACPTDPFVRPDTNESDSVRLPEVVTSLSAFQVIPAVFKMDLTPPDCKEPYRAAQMIDWGGEDTEFFDTSAGLHAAATVRAFVDSDGKVVAVDVVHSSGSAIVDGAATAKAAKARYSPAMFRCTPVVGSVLVDVKYEVRP